MLTKVHLRCLVLLIFFIVGCSHIEEKKNPDKPEDLKQMLSSVRLPTGIYKFSRRGRRRWSYIVIHHSATWSGNAASFGRYHRKKGWRALAYHFVVNNGNGSADGKIEIGSRWKKKMSGGHVSWRGQAAYNMWGIGICLTGNFNYRHPTLKQKLALLALVLELKRRYRIPTYRILGHNEVPSYHRPVFKFKTSCPGRLFSMDRFRQMVRYLDKRLYKRRPPVKQVYRRYLAWKQRSRQVWP